MLTILSFVIAVLAAVAGYATAKGFVRRRLRFVDAVNAPYVPFIVAIGAALLAMPVVGILPLIGKGTALLFGAAVGAGVSAGTRDNRRLLPPD